MADLEHTPVGTTEHQEEEVALSQNPVVGEEDNEGEESDTYDDDFEADADGNDEDGEDDDYEDDGNQDEEEDNEPTQNKSNLTALLLDPGTGGAEDDDEGANDAEDEDEDEDYVEEPVHANGDGVGKKRSFDDVDAEGAGLETDEREAAVKKVKA